MSTAFKRLTSHLLPVLPSTPVVEQLRTGGGALVGIAACAVLVLWMPFVAGHSVYLIAPLGASAVLIFGVPNSPLAQPWSAVMGNMVSALVAVAVLTVLPDAALTTGLAVGAAIVAMMLIRALHPPGGAVALLTALDPQQALLAGVWFALVPVGITTVFLVGLGIAYNRLTGRVYPFRQPVVTPSTAPADPRLGLTTDELSELLQRFHQSTNLGVADLGRLLAAAEAEAASHRFEGTTCADIMTQDLITLPADASLRQIAGLFRAHPIKSLPVTGPNGQLLGLVLQADLIEALLRPRALDPLRTKGRADRITAAQVMRPATTVVPDDLPVGQVLNRMAQQGVQVLPVMRQEQLVGILTRSDIMGLLLHGAYERPSGG